MRKKKKNSTGKSPVVLSNQQEEPRNDSAYQEAAPDVQIDASPQNLQRKAAFFVVGIGASAGGFGGVYTIFFPYAA